MDRDESVFYKCAICLAEGTLSAIHKLLMRSKAIRMTSDMVQWLLRQIIRLSESKLYRGIWKKGHI